MCILCVYIYLCVYCTGAVNDDLWNVVLSLLLQNLHSTRKKHGTLSPHASRGIYPVAPRDFSGEVKEQPTHCKYDHNKDTLVSDGFDSRMNMDEFKIFKPPNDENSIGIELLTELRFWRNICIHL